jgi:hypothetical protein
MIQMNQKITDYSLLDEKTSDNLNQAVSEFMEDGWQPFGSPSVIPETEEYYASYCQAMVKYEEELP